MRRSLPFQRCSRNQTHGCRRASSCLTPPRTVPLLLTSPINRVSVVSGLFHHKSLGTCFRGHIFNAYEMNPFKEYVSNSSSLSKRKVVHSLNCSIRRCVDVDYSHRIGLCPWSLGQTPLQIRKSQVCAATLFAKKLSSATNGLVN